MKSIHSIIAFVCIVTVGLGACKKFLTTAPADTITVDNYYQNQTQLNAALTNVYNKLIIYAYGNTGQTLTSTIGFSDEAIYSYNNPLANDGSKMGSYYYDYTNAQIKNLWSGLYLAIYDANLLLANIDNASSTTSQAARNYISGQALFLRGFSYYLLGSHFGGVPLRVGSLNLNSTDLARSSLADTYGQAVSDIEAAIPLLLSSAATGTPSRISQTAAQGILARIFLTMASPGSVGLNDTKYYDSTIYYAKQVVSSGQHSLYTGKQGITTPDSSYAYIFINESRQLINMQECMWEATFSGNDNTSTYTFQGTQGWYAGIPFATTFNDASIGYSYGNVNTTKAFYSLYQTGDSRLNWNISPYYYTSATAKANFGTTSVLYYARFAAKWRREFETYTPKSKYSSPASFPIIRYSDVLLMLAEAELQSATGDKTDALNNVNMVRRRAYGFPVNTANATADLTSLTLNNIIDEREKELCFEAVRWVDIRRWGIYQSRMQDMVNQMVSDGLPSGTYFYTGVGAKTVTYPSEYLYATVAASSTKFNLLPIPASEMSTNALCAQNPGW